MIRPPTLVMGIAAGILAGAAFTATATAPLPWVGRYAPLPGNVAASPLVTPTSARNLGMGAAGVADPTTPANVVYNPANLVGVDGVFAFYNTYKLYEMIDVHDVGVAATKTWRGSGVRGAIAVRQQSSHLDQSSPYLAFYPSFPTSGYQSDDRGTGVAAAMSFPVGGVDLAVGVGAEYATLEILNDARAWAFDIGASVGGTVENTRGDQFETRAGVSALNVGRGFESGTVQSDSPQQIRAGFSASYAFAETMPAPFSGRARISALSLDFDIVLDDPAIESPTAAVGFEYAFAQALFVRAGYGGRTLTRDDGLSVGVGLAAHAGPLCFRTDWAVSASDLDYGGNGNAWGFAAEYRPSGSRTDAATEQ